MAIVKRYDRGELKPAKKDEKGWLRAEGFIARAGILEYSHADGKTWKEYRPPDEAFSPEALASFELVPLTNDHPPGFLLDAGNTEYYQVGSVGNVRRDGDLIKASILVTEPKAIAAMENGRVFLSMGYDCEVHPESGVTPSGERYDFVQRNVKGNHVALVDIARGGPALRARLDSGDAIAVESSHADSIGLGSEKGLIKIHLDGVEVEVSETVAQLIKKTEAAHAEKFKAAQTKVEQLTARADSLDTDVKKLQIAVAAAPEKVRAEIKARVELEAKASEILTEAKFDGISDAEIRRQAVAAANPDLKLEGKSDEYVAAAFDIAVAQHAQENSGVAKIQAAIHADGGDDSTEFDFNKAISNAWRSKAKE